MSYSSTIWPAMKYPQPIPRKVDWTAQPTPIEPNHVPPEAKLSDHNWKAAPPEPNTTTYVKTLNAFGSRTSDFASGSNEIGDTTLSTGVDDYFGWNVRMLSGANIGQQQKIISNTINGKFTLKDSFLNPILVGDIFEVVIASTAAQVRAFFHQTQDEYPDKKLLDSPHPFPTRP